MGFDLGNHRSHHFLGRPQLWSERLVLPANRRSAQLAAPFDQNDGDPESGEIGGGAQARGSAADHQDTPGVPHSWVLSASLGEICLLPLVSASTSSRTSIYAFYAL